MSIVNYLSRIYKTVVPAIDRVMAKRSPKMVAGNKNIAGANSLSEVISADTNWQLDSISFKFSNNTSRDFGFAFMHGCKVVTNYNDFLWIQINTALPQIITLSEGFYTGTQLAAELKKQLDANAVFTAASVTFTVTYNNLTGLFVITPSGTSTIRYINTNNRSDVNTCDSIAGHLFGLTVDTNFAANVTTDTPVPGLNDESDIVYTTGSGALSYYHDTMHTMSIDQAVHLKSSNTAAVIIDWAVVYEEIV